MTMSLPYLKKWQINIENSDNSLEILKNISFQLYWLFVILHSYSTYSVISYLFCPLYLCVKPQATPIVRNIITCFQHTHVVKIRCRRGPWLGVFPLKSIRSHETCAHTLSNKCPGQLCNTLYTQHTVQYTIYEWKVSITTSLRKGIIRGQKVTKQSLKKGVWRCIAQLRSTLNS